MHHLALLSLAICAPSARAAQDAASTVDLEALTAALRPAEEWFVLGPPLSPYWCPPEEAQQKPWLANGQEVDGDVADILRFRLPELAATLAEGAGEHDSSDAAAAEARAARLLERWATRRWCVDLIELPREAAATLDSALLSPSDVDALLARFPDVATRTTLATPRRAARFDERRRLSYIQDFEIDYGSGGLHPDPCVGVARFGRDTRVRVHSRSRTSHFVDVCTSGGEPDGPGRTLRIFEGEWPVLDLPEAVYFVGAASAVVVDGGALVLAPCGVDGGVTLVRVTRVDDGPEDAGTASIGLGGFANVRHSWPAD